MALAVGMLAGVLSAGAAHGVPSFARQTGQACVACHVSFPELTPYGRYFKLTGYTIGKSAFSSEGMNYLPLAAMVQASVTSTRDNHATDPDTGATVSVNQRNNSGVFCCASVFLASKISDYLGGFVQWSYDNLATTADGTLGGHSGIDNTDIRIVGSHVAAGGAEPDLIYGATLNNNPTVQDVWNSTPAFGFPFTASSLASTPAAASTRQSTGSPRATWERTSSISSCSAVRRIAETSTPKPGSGSSSRTIGSFGATSAAGRRKIVRTPSTPLSRRGPVQPISTLRSLRTSMAFESTVR